MGIYNTQFASLEITFTEDAYDPTGSNDPDDVTNPDNYLLIQSGGNTAYDTTSCLDVSNNGGVVLGDDIQIPTGPVIYNPATFTAIVTLNNGTPLAYGECRLFVCGTTSIVDLAGNPLNHGADTVTTFTLVELRMPDTGFPMGQVTRLSAQPESKAHSATEMTLEIPALGVEMPIVGVPQTSDGWDMTWLGNNAGYLAGSAFPTWAGNTVITGHVWDAYNQPGSFADLKTLKYVDHFYIYAFGKVYAYEVRENKLVKANNVQSILQHEQLDWVVYEGRKVTQHGSNSI